MLKGLLFSFVCISAHLICLVFCTPLFHIMLPVFPAQIICSVHWHVI
jgi:hypothetical protein